MSSALPQFTAAILVAATGLAAGVARPWIAAIAGVLVVAALFRWARAAADLGRRRRAADEWFLWGSGVRPSSALLGWRARELTSPRVRLTLARSLRGIERELGGSSLPGPVPLNRCALCLHAGLLRALHERLADATQPVSVRGMVAAPTGS